MLASLTFLAARVWWLSRIVPGQDYPQFLVLVRAAKDCGDPSSPFYGTYRTASWFIPTVLPIEATRLLGLLCHGSIEVAGRLLLTIQNIGMLASSAYLLRVLGRSRWAVVLLFPIIHSRWTVVGGYAAYATALPLIILGWALAVRWFHRLDVPSGVLLSTCLCMTLLWHGLGYAVLGLGYATLWTLWRAPSMRARALSVSPTLPSFALLGVWLGSTFERKAEPDSWSWRPAWEAADKLLLHVWATVPHATARALLLAALVVGGLVASRRNIGASGPTARMWRVDNPFLFLAGVYLAAYFALPIGGLGVEVVSPRFSFAAIMAFVFAWNLPAARAARIVVVAAMAGFAVWCLIGIADCFREFDVETRGASYLMDRVGRYETLYSSPADAGASAAFAAGNRAMIELEQFSAVRHGGLPNSSFAGYGVGFVRYVDKNPMPSMRGPPSWSPEMTRFDYVLARVRQGPTDPRFRRLEERDGWELYAVCGSHHLPACGDGT